MGTSARTVKKRMTTAPFICRDEDKVDETPVVAEVYPTMS
jgi:hypothetical protein